MRLREIQKIIDENMQNIVQAESTYDGNSQYFIQEYRKKFRSIIEIHTTGIIDDELNEMTQNSLLVNSSLGEKILFSKQQSELFIQILNKIVLKCAAASDLIVQNLHSESENENSLVISLPDRDLTFKEFNEIVETLNETLRLLSVIPEFQSEIKLSNFDVGSEWLVLSFIADKAVKIFGRLTTVVQRTQVGMRQNKALDAQLETLELDAKTLSDFKEATAKANAKINEKLAKRFLEEENLDTTGEILNQMTKVIENTDKLMNIGVGFTSAITATNEVANTFPPLIEQKQLDKVKALESIKQIEEKTDTENVNDEKED